jgi:sirohydrochlorin cobaltochelatase
VQQFDSLPADVGILVVGHGTRKAAGADQLRQLVQHMRDLRPHWSCYESFLELAEPTIEQAVATAASQGITRMLVVPVLLFSAAHAKSDIPDAVAESASAHGVSLLGQTPSLGTEPTVLQLSNTRFNEVARDAKSTGCPEGHCSQVVCPSSCRLRSLELGSIGLAMVGRGTSELAALEHMRELTRLGASERRLNWVETGFFAGGVPDVDRLLDAAASACGEHGPCQTIVVQPHLLFEGELMDQLRRKVQDRIARHPDRNWVLARALGADRGLANVFVSLACDALAGSL